MQSQYGNYLIAYAKHKFILTMLNGEYRCFNGGDVVFADASQILIDKCVGNVVLVTKDTLSLFLPMLKEETLNLYTYKKAPSLVVHHCSREIPVFQEVVHLSQNQDLRYGEILRKRALTFALLSIFLEDKQFIPLLMNILRPNMRTRVCTVINNNIAHEWSLAQIASELLQLIVVHGFPIKRVAVSCGYNSASYFIYVFRNYYGMTPTEYQERIAQGILNGDPIASFVGQGNFYSSERHAEGIRL